ncbi:MAG: hypothetical protein ACYSSN_12235 [Planctomycetota bacterium]
MEQFLTRHKEHITGVLSGFDRVLFRGTLRSISHVEGMSMFLSCRHVLLKDFGAFVEKQSTHLKEHAKAFALRHARPYQYTQSSSVSKEQIAKGIMKRDGITKGLICVLSCVEPCQCYAIRKDRESKKLQLIVAKRKCLHFYFYFIDREFGFMHVRLQSWFPFPIQVCINGREWLAREMDKAGIDYLRRENCFVHITEMQKAQEMADATAKRNWHKLLNRFSDRFNPLLQQLDIHGYYWTIREAEYATDIIFKDADYLKEVYKTLIHHAIENFSCEDVMRFLQRRSNVRFKGEVVSDIRKRVEGTRIRHRVEENSIKMYDKQEYVLRIETTINNPRRFKVYRNAYRKGQQTKAWIPMRKGIADIYRRVELSRAANARYIDAFSVIGNHQPSHHHFDAVCKPVHKNKRRYRPLRPIAPDEAKLFESVLHGEFLLRGFRNADLRALLFQETNSQKQKCRHIGKTSRLIRLLRAHGLIQKVSKTRLYRITRKGHLLMSTSVNFRNSNISMLQNAA